MVHSSSRNRCCGRRELNRCSPYIFGKLFKYKCEMQRNEGRATRRVDGQRWSLKPERERDAAGDLEQVTPRQR